MTVPFWLDDSYVPRPPLDSDTSCDISILGGGLTGSAAAWFLAGRGYKVALLDRGPIAAGASGRNAGFLLAGIANCYSVAIKSHGRERARSIWSVTRENHRLLREMIESERIDCQYARNGSYTLALSDQEATELRRSVKALAEDGFPGELLDDSQASRLFPGSGALGGLYIPDNGEIHPVRFVRGLAGAAEKRGARIFEQTPVLSIEHGPSSVALVTPRGRVVSTMLLLASNAWTPLLHPFFDGAITGVRGQMFATEPCSRRLIPAPVYADFGFEYFRQLPDGRILAGGGRRSALEAELTYVEKPTERVQAAIDSFLHSCIPGTESLRITHRWAGIMGFSCDELPNIGPVPGSVNVYAAAGYHGHGMGFAVVAAKAVSEMMIDGKTSLPCDPFSPRRHVPE